MPGKKKILQIIPAAGWFAVYKNEGEPETLSPLACWALVEDEEGNTNVQGMDADDYVDFVEDIGNFSKYSHKPESAQE